MVKVPEYQSDVLIRPIMQQGVDVRASPEAFGASIGRGMQSVGRGLGQVSDAMAQVRELEDIARAKEADNQYADWVRERMYGDGGFMTMQGRNAIDGRAAFEKEADEKRKEFGKGLTGGAAQKFDTASRSRLQSVYQQSIVHTANERKTWFAEASASRVKTFEDDALANFSNPAQIQKNIAAGIAEIREQASLQGLDADTLKLRESAFASGVHKNIALRMAQDDPLKAEAYIKSAGDGVSEKDRYALREALEAPILAAKANQNVMNIVSGVDAPEAGSDDDMALPDPLRDGQKVPSVMDRGPIAGPMSFQDVTKQVIGMSEGRDAAAISSFIKRSAGVSIDPRVTPWCAAFVNAVLGAQGIEGTGKLSARSFMNFGMPTDAPKPGDIVVLSRGTGGQGHVGFFQGYDANGNILVLGGNQSNSVKVSAYGSDLLLGFRTAGAVNEQTARLPNYNPTGLASMYERLSGITDPKEFEATRKALDAHLTMQKKAMDANQEQVKAWAEAQVAANPSIDMMQLPADVRTTIGASGMTTLMNYQEKVRSAGEPVTDDRVLHDLQMMDPEELAETDLFQFRDKLSNSDWEKARGWKQSALGDKRKAKDEHLNITSAFNQATDNLRAVGIVKDGKDMREDDRKRVAQFNNALTIQMEEFRAENNRVPSQVEVQSMINRLLLPVVVSEPRLGGWLGTSTTDAFVFEAGTRSDTATVDVVVEYADIPVDLRRGISLDLERELGRKPKEAEIVSRYEEFVLNR